jgi:hypothetical protein
MFIQVSEITLDWHQSRLDHHMKTHLQEKLGQTIQVEGLRPTSC